LSNSAGQVLKTTISVNGRFEFLDLKPGTYKLKYPAPLPSGARVSGGVENPLTLVVPVGLPFRARGGGYYLPPTTPLLQKSLVLDLNAHAEPTRTQLQWINNSGSENDYFTLEKQDPTTGIFNKIETINSKNSLTNEVYTAYDGDITEGENTYRIQLKMLDGSIKMSENKTVFFENFDNIRIYPNPASDYIDLDLRKYEGKKVTLTVYNQVGKRLKSQVIEKASSASVHLDMSGQGDGQMLLRVSSEGRREVMKKFLIQH
jgi:Secretion system C-terminal sorting domain